MMPKGTNPVVIGIQKTGETKITPTTDANSSDKIGMKDGGLLTKISIQQMESTKDSFGLDAPAKDNFNRDNGKSGQAKASDAPIEFSVAAGGASSWQRSSPLSQGSSGAGSGQTRTSFDKDLKYPIDLGNGSQDVIKFDMLKYEPKSTSGSSTRIGFGNRSSTDSRIIGSCFLPIPAGIQDASSVGFADDNMNAFQAALAAASMTGLKEMLVRVFSNSVMMPKQREMIHKQKMLLLLSLHSKRQEHKTYSQEQRVSF